MSPREAFQLGFLLRCAEAGLDVGQAEQLSKQAASKQAVHKHAAHKQAEESVLNKVLSPAGLIAGAAIGAPPLAGHFIGQALAKAQDLDIGITDVERQELIDEYTRLASQIRDKTRRKQRRQETV